MTGEADMTDKVTEADREAAEKFGNAWRMSAAMKYGLANILSQHRTNTELVEALREVDSALLKLPYTNRGGQLRRWHTDVMNKVDAALSLHDREG